MPVDVTETAPEVGLDPRVFGQFQINVYFCWSVGFEVKNYIAAEVCLIRCGFDGINSHRDSLTVIS